MTPNLENKLITDVATILERTGSHSKMLDAISKKQDFTNGRVTKSENDIKELNRVVGELEKNDHTQSKEIKEVSKLRQMVKDNWKGVAFILGVLLWIFEHGYIHI